MYFLETKPISTSSQPPEYHAHSRGTLEARGIPGPSRGTCLRYILGFQRTLVFHEVLSKVKLISNGDLSKLGGSPDLPEDLVHARGTLEARTGGVTKFSLGHKASATGWQSARPLEMKGRWVGCDSDVNADFNRGDGQGGNIGCCWPRTFFTVPQKGYGKGVRILSDF